MHTHSTNYPEGEPSACDASRGGNPTLNSQTPNNIQIPKLESTVGIKISWVNPSYSEYYIQLLPLFDSR